MNIKPATTAFALSLLCSCLALAFGSGSPAGASGTGPQGGLRGQDAARARVEAEALYDRGSYARAGERYAQLDLEALEPDVQRWVRFRRADCAWRALDGSQQSDPSGFEAAREELQELLGEYHRVEDRDAAWVGATESLGDYHWVRQRSRNWGQGWNYYQEALEYWARSSDLDRARRRYLDVVFRVVEPPHSIGNYWQARQVPVEILENARRIAVERDDRSKAVFFLAFALRYRGLDARGQRRLRALFDEALELGTEAAWYDDALFQYAQWLESAGRVVVREDGTRTAQPDYPAAVALYRRLVEEFRRGESAWRDNAEQRIQAITAPTLAVGVGHTFLPGSLVQLDLSWRNVDQVELSLYPVDLMADLSLTRSENPVGTWHEALSVRGRTPAVTWRHATGDEGLHVPGSALVSPSDEPLATGAYLLVATAGGQTAREVVLVTDAALVVRAGGERGVVYACDATRGAPLADAEVRVWRGEWDDNAWHWKAAAGDAREPGLFTADLSTQDHNVQFLVVARSGENQAVALGNHWSGRHADDEPWKIHVSTDRPAYRPEETVSFKVTARTRADGVYATPAGRELGYRIVGPRGDEVGKGTLKLSSFGGGWDSLALSPEMALGEYRVEFTAGNRHVGAATLFRLEEYRLPEFRVTVETPEDEDGNPRIFRPGDAIEADVAVEYYFGGGVADAECVVEVYQRPWRAVWTRPREYPWLQTDSQTSWRGPRGPWWGGSVVHRVTVRTDAEGRAPVRFEVPDGLDGDFEYEFKARVTDSSRREVAGSGSVRTARQGHFVHARVERPLVRPGDEAEALFRAVDANDRPVQVSGRVQVLRQVWREVWRGPGGRPVEGAALEDLRRDGPWPLPGWRRVRAEHESEVVLSRLLTTDAEGEAQLVFQPERAGHYVVRWESRDEEGIPISAEGVIWVGDRDTTELGYRHGGLKLVLDDESFRRGRTSPVMLLSPSADRWVLVAVEADGLLEWRLVHVKGTVALVEFDVGAAWEPNVFLSGVLVQDGEALVDRVEVVVPPEEHYLDVAVDLAGDAFTPGAKTRARVTVKDHAGEPVAAELSLAVVDEAILAIQSEYAPDPRAFFFGTKRGPGVTDTSSFHLRRYARLVRGEGERFVDERFAALDAQGAGGSDSEQLRALGYVQEEADVGSADFFLGEGESLGRMARAPAAKLAMAESARDDADGGYRGPGDTAPPGGEGGSVVVRSDFRSTALWKPDVVTGADGTAELELDWPESLTSWKATARVATAGDAFGTSTSTARTRLPLMCRLQTPRFFVVGDEATVSTNLNNGTDEPLSVEVAMTVTGVRLLGDSPMTVEVPARGAARVDWHVALDEPGSAEFEVTARAGALGDGVQKSVPVHAHGIEQQLTRAGMLAKDEVALGFELPPRRPGSTTLTVQVTPSLGAALLDALPYLIDYPYGCTEQTMSRFLPAVVVARTLRELGVDEEQIAGVMFGGIEAEHADETHEDGPKSLAELDAMVGQGLKRLADFQHGDGGWGWWERGDSDAFMTAYVVWGLSLARDAGVDVESNMLRRAARWLDGELVEAERRPDLQAWMLHACAAASAERTKFANTAIENLWAQKDRLNAYTRALFALALHAYGDAERAEVLAENLANGVRTDTTPDTSIVQRGASSSQPFVMPTARWGEDGVGYRWSSGGVESTAFALRALLAIAPDSELVEPAVTWLVRNRRGAQWNNTRDSAICILALVERMKQTGELAAEVGYRVEVNGSVLETAGDGTARALAGRVALDVPSELLRDGPNEVRIVRTAGDAPLYFTASASFFSLAEPVTPAGHELFVRRQYVRLVPRETLLAGPVFDRVPLVEGEPVTSGERIEVVVTLEAKNELEYLLIEDLKPAGFEAVQQKSGQWMTARELRSDAIERRLAGALPEPDDATGRSRGLYQELRDRHVAFFLDRCPQGFWELRYELRAEAPGDFHALPVLGEAMYVPEIRANGRETRVRVIDRE